MYRPATVGPCRVGVARWPRRTGSGVLIEPFRAHRGQPPWDHDHDRHQLGLGIVGGLVRPGHRRLHPLPRAHGVHEPDPVNSTHNGKNGLSFVMPQASATNNPALTACNHFIANLLATKEAGASHGWPGGSRPSSGTRRACGATTSGCSIRGPRVSSIWAMCRNLRRLRPVLSAVSRGRCGVPAPAASGGTRQRDGAVNRTARECVPATAAALCGVAISIAVRGTPAPAAPSPPPSARPRSCAPIWRQACSPRAHWAIRRVHRW